MEALANDPYFSPAKTRLFLFNSLGLVVQKLKITREMLLLGLLVALTAE